MEVVSMKVAVYTRVSTGHLFLHFAAALRNPFSPLIKASFLVLDQHLICASRLEAELRSGCFSE